MSPYIKPRSDEFWCDTCRSAGGLRIGNVTYLELTCPTCHGESRGCSVGEFFKQMEEDAKFDEEHNKRWLDELRRRRPK